ncbi:MAG TPA: hypothetical protein VFI91_10065 [Longimicrobiaceae bacterium]|nr:hypothetical protein [Longimicrobiaceae bacterium]
MKLVPVLGIAGFLLGLSGATGLVIVRGGEPANLAQVIADSTAAGTDTTAHANADSIGFGFELPGTADLAIAAADSLATDSVAVKSVEAKSAATNTATSDSSTVAARERLAKLFGAMQPRDAARVMEKMGDHEVQVILSLLRDRQAGAILSSLPPERAAAITTMVFSGVRSMP